MVQHVSAEGTPRVSTGASSTVCWDVLGRCESQLDECTGRPRSWPLHNPSPARTLCCSQRVLTIAVRALIRELASVRAGARQLAEHYSMCTTARSTGRCMGNTRANATLWWPQGCLRSPPRRHPHQLSRRAKPVYPYQRSGGAQHLHRSHRRRAGSHTASFKRSCKRANG